ncbi:MAG: putative bifunctional diguanylate cyclase/phosphodiesterase, partial [Gammaproteobacteria bacterium]
FAANGDRHGFVYSGDFDTDLTFIHDVRALTGARHFVWCYNRVSRLAIVFANGVDGQDDSWQFSAADAPMIEAVLDVVGSVVERAKMEQQLAQSVFHDSLTGLPNRGLLMRHLEACVQRAGRDAREICALLFVDVDRFKWVNDTLGHLAGDKLLAAIAQRLRGVLRPGDLLARLNGDEFAVLSDHLGTVNDAESVAKRMLAALATPFRIHGHSVYAKVSIGIAEARPSHQCAADFLRDADIAMYHAKEEGGGSYQVFGNEMRGRTVSDLRLQGDLRQALEREELSLYYQPIFDLHSGAVESVEALLRWHHPREGLLEPERFVGLLEKTGLFGEVGDWVLQRVARDINLWRNEISGAPDIKVCVNISQSQFVHTDFVNTLSALMNGHSIKPEQLRLELTERTLLDCKSIDHEVLNRLRRMGVKIMLDDFGTGYSSLSRLQSLPIDTVKIDRSFVDLLGSDGSNQALVAAIVALAKNLSMRTVAEGAERPSQLEALRKLGCDAVQGYVLGRPMAASKVSGFIANQSTARGVDVARSDA